MVKFQNQNRTRMVPPVCMAVLGEIGSSFVFDSSKSDVLSKSVYKIVAKLMNTLVLLPEMQWVLDESLLKLLSTFEHADNIDQFDSNFRQFLAEIYDEFFKPNDLVEATSEHHAHKLTVSYDFINYILSFMQSTADKLKELPEGSNSQAIQMPQPFYSILYWPLSLSLAKSEVSSSEN